MLHYSAFEQYFFEKILRMIILIKFLAGIFRKKYYKGKEGESGFKDKKGGKLIVSR